MERLETEIAEKETEFASVTAVINEPDFYTTHANPQEMFSRYAQLKQEIEGLYGKLERLEGNSEGGSEKGEGRNQRSEAGARS